MIQINTTNVRCTRFLFLTKPFICCEFPSCGTENSVLDTLCQVKTWFCISPVTLKDMHVLLTKSTNKQKALSVTDTPFKRNQMYEDSILLHMSIKYNGEGNGNPLQYSCLENPMDRGAWWATVHGVTKSQTWLTKHIKYKNVTFKKFLKFFLGRKGISIYIYWTVTESNLNDLSRAKKLCNEYNW